MARTIHIELTGQAEDLLKELEKAGLNGRDAIAKGLWLLDRVKAGQVAMSEDFNGEPNPSMSLLTLPPPKSRPTGQPTDRHSASPSTQSPDVER